VGGIKKIQQRRDDEKSSSGGSGRELWLKDGDEAFVSILASGDEEDDRLDDLYIHSLQFTRDDGSTGWRTAMCQKENGECSHCADDRPGHQFAMWVYAHSIFHPNQGDSSWTEQKDRRGTVRYRENIGEIRVFTRGFGRADYLWNMLVDVYNLHDGLNNTIVRIKRTGSGPRDTSYNITGVPAAEKTYQIPEEAQGEIEKLPPIKEFFVSRESARQTATQPTQPSSKTVDFDNFDEGSENSDDGDLF